MTVPMRLCSVKMRISIGCKNSCRKGRQDEDSCFHNAKPDAAHVILLTAPRALFTSLQRASQRMSPRLSRGSSALLYFSPNAPKDGCIVEELDGGGGGLPSFSALWRAIALTIKGGRMVLTARSVMG